MPLRNFCINYYVSSSNKQERFIPLNDGSFTLKCIVFFENCNHYHSWQFDTAKTKVCDFNMNSQKVYSLAQLLKFSDNNEAGVACPNVRYTVFEKTNN
jgi:hypothetical protein